MASGKVLFVRNLPYRATDEDLTNVFSSYGTVKRAFVVLDPITKQSRGFGYVSFLSQEEAKKASLAKITLFDRDIQAKIAEAKETHKKVKNKRRKADFSEKEHDEFESEEENAPVPVSIPPVFIKEGTVKPLKHSDRKKCIRIRLENASLYSSLKSEILSKLASCNLISQVQSPVAKEKKTFVLVECPTRAAAVDSYMKLKELREREILKFTFSYMEQRDDENNITKEVKEEPTTPTTIGSVKNFRLIVRNLPFSVTELALQNSFAPLGKLLEVVLPRKPDGKARGFAFIQYAEESSASKALETVNMSKILGRVVAVDWAVPKKQYISQDSTDVKEEVDSNFSEDANSLPDNKDVSMEVDNLDDSVKEDPKEAKVTITPKALPEDISEGKTVFIRGLAFSTEEEVLKTSFEQLFGPVVYGKICLDDLGRSKGTAFVKFENSENSDEAVRRSEESPLILDGRRLMISSALTRKAAVNVKQNNEKKVSDARNLRLASVGLIKQGSIESIGISAENLAKREAIHSANVAKLKNPSTFVSDVRISIHNLPTSVDDHTLKMLILKTVDSKSCRISECRVMRDLTRVNSAGVGRSRGYAFVAFNEHKHALTALQRLNNNPEIFGEKKRLIVQFSIENKKALEIKQKRLENFPKSNQDNLAKKKKTISLRGRKDENGKLLSGAQKKKLLRQMRISGGQS